MATSPYHRSFTVSDLSRLIIPPLRLGQCAAVYERGVLVAWASWAFLSDAASDGFASRTRKLQPEDWNSGPHGWVVDFIAPYGHTKQLIRLMRSHFPKGTAGRATHNGRVMRFRNA